MAHDGASSGIEKLLAEVRELDRSATKGPWEGNDSNLPIRLEAFIATPDAAFISRARTLLPKLAQIVEVLSNACAYRAVHPQSNTEEGKCRDALRSAEEIAGG